MSHAQVSCTRALNESRLLGSFQGYVGSVRLRSDDAAKERGHVPCTQKKEKGKCVREKEEDRKIQPYHHAVESNLHLFQGWLLDL